MFGKKTVAPFDVAPGSVFVFAQPDADANPTKSRATNPAIAIIILFFMRAPYV